MTRPGLLAAALMLAPLAGCQGAQSAFDPAGVEAERVLTLFWIMLAGGTAIWIVVIGLSYYAARGKSGSYSDRSGIRLIVWGGCVFPFVVLAGLLWWGLTMMPELEEAGSPSTASLIALIASALAASSASAAGSSSAGGNGKRQLMTSMLKSTLSASEEVLPLSPLTNLPSS